MPHAIVAFFLTLIMYVIFAAICQITPFGENTWLVYNMKTQYVDFYGYFSSILSGENNIFYSFSTTLGSGTIGFCTYYLTSPFLFLVALFPKTMLPLAMTIVIGLKLSLAAMTMDMFLQRFCGKSAYMCSITYGFSAFLIANAMNIMWLDAIILIPVVMTMTERLIKDGKLVGYIISVAAMLYLNYYISYMALIFVFMWTVFRVWALKEKNPMQIVYRLGMATILSAGIDMVLLMPTFLELKNNSLIGGTGAEEIATVVDNISIKQVLTKLFSLAFDSIEIYWGAPMLFTGVLCIVLVGLYFINGRIPWRERLSMLFILIVFILSFVIENINLLWHVGVSHSDFPYREAILATFVLITCACRSVKEVTTGLRGRMVAGFLIVGSLTAFVFIHPVTHLDVWKVVLNIGIVVVSLSAIGIVMYAESRQMKVLIAALLITIQFVDLGLNAVYIYKSESIYQETDGEFQVEVRRAEEAVNDIKAMDTSFYRMDTWSPRQQNDGMMLDYHSITNYSIASLPYSRDFLQKMGYDDDSTYLEYGHDNTETADSILGIKYILTDKAHDSRMHTNYMLVRDGSIQAYKNPYALSIATGVYREMSGESMDPFSLQEDIYSQLASEMVDIFIPADIVESDVEIASRPQEHYEVTATASGQMYFYMTDLIDNFENMEVYIDGEFYTYYGNDACLKVLNLGYMKAGDVMDVTIVADDEDEFGTPLFMTEDIMELKRAYDIVQSRRAKVQKLSSSHLMLTIDSAYTVGDEISGEVGVFTTIPYEKGWRVKVAGATVEPIEVYDSLMYIPVTQAIQLVELEPGQNLEIELMYIPDGLILGIGISVTTILIMILILALRRSEAEYFVYEDEEEDEESNL